MKKITFLILIVFFATQLSSISQALDETEFVAAKAQILYVYQGLETNAFKLSLLFEQKAEEMSMAEQGAVVGARSDLELGMFIVKNVLALYTLQGCQVSTPPEAQKLLINASLDANDFLSGLQQRLEIRASDINNQEARNILTQSSYLLGASIEAVNTLKLTIEDM